MNNSKIKKLFDKNIFSICYRIDIYKNVHKFKLKIVSFICFSGKKFNILINRRGDIWIKNKRFLQVLNEIFEKELKLSNVFMNHFFNG